MKTIRIALLELFHPAWGLLSRINWLRVRRTFWLFCAGGQIVGIARTEAYGNRAWITVLLIPLVVYLWLACADE